MALRSGVSGNIHLPRALAGAMGMGRAFITSSLAVCSKWSLHSLLPVMDDWKSQRVGTEVARGRSWTRAGLPRTPGSPWLQPTCPLLEMGLHWLGPRRGWLPHPVLGPGLSILPSQRGKELRRFCRALRGLGLGRGKVAESGVV